MPTFSVQYLGLNPPYHTDGIPKNVEADSITGAVLAYNGDNEEEVLAGECYHVSLEPVVVEVESFTYKTVVPS